MTFVTVTICVILLPLISFSLLLLFACSFKWENFPKKTTESHVRAEIPLNHVTRTNDTIEVIGLFQDMHLFYARFSKRLYTSTIFGDILAYCCFVRKCGCAPFKKIAHYQLGVERTRIRALCTENG